MSSPTKAVYKRALEIIAAILDKEAGTCPADLCDKSVVIKLMNCDMCDNDSPKCWEKWGIYQAKQELATGGEK